MTSRTLTLDDLRKMKQNKQNLKNLKSELIKNEPEKPPIKDEKPAPIIATETRPTPITLVDLGQAVEAAKRMEPSMPILIPMNAESLHTTNIVDITGYELKNQNCVHQPSPKVNIDQLKIKGIVAVKISDYGRLYPSVKYENIKKCEKCDPIDELYQKSKLSGTLNFVSPLNDSLTTIPIPNFITFQTSIEIIGNDTWVNLDNAMFKQMSSHEIKHKILGYSCKKNYEKVTDLSGKAGYITGEFSDFGQLVDISTIPGFYEPTSTTDPSIEEEDDDLVVEDQNYSSDEDELDFEENRIKLKQLTTTPVQHSPPPEVVESIIPPISNNIESPASTDVITPVSHNLPPEAIEPLIQHVSNDSDDSSSTDVSIPIEPKNHFTLILSPQTADDFENNMKYFRDNFSIHVGLRACGDDSLSVNVRTDCIQTVDNLINALRQTYIVSDYDYGKICIDGQVINNYQINIRRAEEEFQNKKVTFNEKVVAIDPVKNQPYWEDITNNPAPSDLDNRKESILNQLIPSLIMGETLSSRVYLEILTMYEITRARDRLTKRMSISLCHNDFVTDGFVSSFSLAKLQAELNYAPINIIDLQFAVLLITCLYPEVEVVWDDPHSVTLIVE